MPPCRLWLFLKLAAIFLLLYGMAHLLFSGQDLGWMPPAPDLTYVTDSPRKKHPDGPLVLRDGILAESEENKGKLVKAVLVEPAEANFDVQIKEGNDGQKKTVKKLPISEQFLAKFRRAARQIHQRLSLPRGFVLLNVINRAYLELTLNWLCNLYALPSWSTTMNSTKEKPEGNVELLSGTLLVALDGGQTCKEVKKAWPQVTCLSLLEKQTNPKSRLDAQEQKAFNEALSWGRIRYVQILTARANLMAALVEAKVPFVVAESDALWLGNPFRELFTRADLVEDADLVMPLNSAQGQHFAFDPMVVFATNGSRQALQEMRRVLNRETTTMDQDLLNQICSTQYAGLVCREFTPKQVADGAWFKLSEPERANAAREAGHWPLLVNNNFYVGVHNKMARQAINGLWFLSTKQKQCNLAKTRRILQKYAKVP